MSIEVIDKIKQKNGKDFKLMDAADVAMADGRSVEEAIAEGFEIPVFNLKEMGASSIPVAGGIIQLETDTTEIMEAVSNGPIKLVIPFAEDEEEMTVDVVMNGIAADGMAQGRTIVSVNEPMVILLMAYEGVIAVALVSAEEFFGFPEEKVATAVDLTNFETDGIITETFEDGSTNTYTFVDDTENNSTTVTDSNGNSTVINGMNIGYSWAEEASF